MTGTDLGLQCRCGAVRGVAHAVSPHAGNRCVCYCNDCQSFAHFLDRAGDVLDEHGGTDIFQMSPANLRFTAGGDRIACVRLTDRGLIRWYASCCATPIGNTLASGRMPFIGVIRAFFREPAGEALGPIRGHAFPESAKRGPTALPKGGLPMPLMMVRVLALLLRWRLRGDQRRSPLFDAATLRPVAMPRVLTPAEREELRRRASA